MANLSFRVRHRKLKGLRILDPRIVAVGGLHREPKRCDPNRQRRVMNTVSDSINRWFNSSSRSSNSFKLREPISSSSINSKWQTVIHPNGLLQIHRYTKASTNLSIATSSSQCTQAQTHPYKDIRGSIQVNNLVSSLFNSKHLRCNSNSLQITQCFSQTSSSTT